MVSIFTFFALPARESGVVVSIRRRRTRAHAPHGHPPPRLLRQGGGHLLRGACVGSGKEACMRFVFFNLAAFLHIFLMFLLFSSHTGWRRHGSLHDQNGLLRQVRASERGGRSSVSYPTSSVIPHNTPHFFFFFFLISPIPIPAFSQGHCSRGRTLGGIPRGADPFPGRSAGRG
jgi:hypothetical protein